MGKWQIYEVDDMGRWGYDEVEAEGQYEAIQAVYDSLVEEYVSRGMRSEGDLLVDKCGCAYHIEVMETDSPYVEVFLFQPCPGDLHHYIESGTQGEYQQLMEEFFEKSSLWGFPKTRYYEEEPV